jgi:hypothetical protein
MKATVLNVPGSRVAHDELFVHVLVAPRHRAHRNETRDRPVVVDRPIAARSRRVAQRPTEALNRSNSSLRLGAEDMIRRLGSGLSEQSVLVAATSS